MYPRKEFAKRRGLWRPLSLHYITRRNMHFIAMQLKVCNDAIANFLPATKPDTLTPLE